MVLVDDKKFACESCIKGHRSSSCRHTNRPLLEIKKKGRPVSQCDNCRRLRKSRKWHSKCLCNDQDKEPDAQSYQPESSRSQSRFVPIAPALPNGLRDALVHPRIVPPIPIRPSITACLCANPGTCKCNNANTSATSSSLGEARIPSRSGLAALAQAAAMCCASPSSQPLSATSNANANGSLLVGSRTRIQGPNVLNSNVSNNAPPLSAMQPSFIFPFSTPTPSLSSPSFPTVPPMEGSGTIARSGCTCGIRCACPRCAEHRGPENVASLSGHACGDCVDHDGGIALPTTLRVSASSNSGAVAAASGNSIIDQFFMRAAALPPPPPGRRGAVALDPTNVAVYPRNGSAQTMFGLVQVPKLQCCQGKCQCMAGHCGCSSACNGRCAEYGGQHSAAQDTPCDHQPSSATLTSTTTTRTITPSSHDAVKEVAESAPAMKSCCASKSKS